MKKDFGEYTATKVLGKGSFGTVYLAVHRATGNTVALKEVLEPMLSEKVRLRLEMEISCQRAVDSEYVVKLIDSFSLPSGQYIALEYCAGGDLEQYLKTHGPVPEHVGRAWIQQLATGFQDLKAKKIMHRDLKVQNILLTANSPEATVKLADFGMSKVMEEDLTTTRLGSPIYMAPELFNIGAKYDLKADVWSFGIVCFQMLTGELPISAKFKSEIPSAQKTLKPIPALISPPCRDLLARMLEYDSARRISFDELFAHPFVQRGVPSEPPEVPLEVMSDSSDEYELVDSDSNQIAEEKSEGESPGSSQSDAEDEVRATSQKVEEAVRGLETELRRADLVDKVLTALRGAREYYGAFALSVKRGEILRRAVERSEATSASLRLRSDLHQLFFACQARVVAAFLEAEARAEGCALELENALARRGPGGVTSLQGIDPERVADYALLRFSLAVMQDAAVDEYAKNYRDCASKYQEGVELLSLLSEPSLAPLLALSCERLDSARAQVPMS